MTPPDTTLAKARRLIEMADQASARPWATTPMAWTAIVSVPGDAELGNWLVCPKVRWPADQAYIIAARNDAPDIAKAIVEAAGLIRAGLADNLREDEQEDLVDRARAWLAQHGEERT